MKKIGFVFLLLIAIMGCQKFEKKKLAQGALSSIQEFHVFMFSCPYENVSQEILFKIAVDSLKQIGDIHVVETNGNLLSAAKAPSLLFLSVGVDKNVSIQVFGEAEVLANRFKIGCCIWKAETHEQKDLSYPEIENGEVVFKRKAAPASSENTDIETIVAQAIEKFVQQYHQENPEGPKPAFYIHKNSLL